MVNNLTALFFIFTLFILNLLNVQAHDDIPEVPVEFSVQTFEGASGENGHVQTFLALNYKNYPEWHTYWKNPGDSGLPIRFEFLLSGEPVEIEAKEWPVPNRYIEPGDIVTYGNSGEYSLFFKPSEQQLQSWEGQDFVIKSSWLVCRHVCIPGRGEVEGKIQSGQFRSTSPQTLKLDTRELQSRLEQLPQVVSAPQELDLILALSEQTNDSLVLYYSLTKKGELYPNRNLLTPFPSDLFGFRREEIFIDSNQNFYGRMKVNWDGMFATPAVSLPRDGQFDDPIEVDFLFSNPVTQETSIISHTFTHFLLDHEKRANDLLSTLTPLDNQVQKITDETDAQSAASDTIASPSKQPSHILTGTLLFYLLFAFLGGFILNFMPCVLPIISLKLFDLIKNRQESRAIILKHNMAYTLGVLSTFLALALSIIVIKSTGEVIGWGFQLQSPLFVMTLIIVLFIMTLNFFGLFEFSTPGGKYLGNVKLNQGFTGDFGSGALATILATPCSAPFLGTALTFAFAASTPVIILMFLTIGLGLAMPFILTGLFPQLINFLPKPGAWMEKLKKFLGMALMLTAIWLLDLYLALVDSTAQQAFLMVCLTFIFFFFYSRRYISKHPLYLSSLMVIVAISFYYSYTSPHTQYLSDDLYGQGSVQKAGMLWENFSQEKLDKLSDQEEIVFVNFTAQWCVTCHFFERVVIDTPAFRNLMRENNVRLLVADWTRGDSYIGDWLEGHGMVGIPAYFIQQSNGELVNLGETISVDRVRRHLK